MRSRFTVVFIAFANVSRTDRDLMMGDVFGKAQPSTDTLHHGGSRHI